MRFILILSLALLACDQVTYIDLEPAPVLLKTRGAVVLMHAKPMSAQQRHFPRAAVTWSVGDSSVAEVSADGKLTARASGHTEVIATHEKVVAATPVDVVLVEKVTVSPEALLVQENGDSVELKIAAFDAKGRELKDRSALLKTSNKDIASVAAHTIIPGSPGAAEITVVVDDASFKLPVTVTAAPQKGSKPK